MREPEVAEKVAEAADIGFVRHQRMGNEKTRPRSPGVCAVAAFASQDGQVIAVDDSERQPNLASSSSTGGPCRLGVTRAKSARRRRRQLAQDEACFDCLAGTDGDRPGFTRGRRSAFRKGRLIGVLMDAGSERREKGRDRQQSRCSSAECAEIRGKDARVVGPVLETAAHPSSARTSAVPSSASQHAGDGFTLGVISRYR